MQRRGRVLRGADQVAAESRLNRLHRKVLQVIDRGATLAPTRAGGRTESPAVPQGPTQLELWEASPEANPPPLEDEDNPF